MRWRTSARHARPRARGPFAAVETPLESDVAQLRAASFSDYLELVRLSALVDGLFAQVERLSLEIPEVRRELQEARNAPAPRDPRVDVLADQVSDLRALFSTQQVLLTDVTRHVLDLLAQLVVLAPPGAVTPAVPAAVVPVAQPVGEVRPDLAAPLARAVDPVDDDEAVLRMQLMRFSVGPMT